MPIQEHKNVPRKDMISVKCFSYQKFGHISANCGNNKINHFKKNMQPMEEHPQRQVPSVLSYKNLVYGYCLLCNDFGHKSSNCRTYGERSRNQINKTSEHFLIFLGHIICYVCVNLGRKAKD